MLVCCHCLVACCHCRQCCYDCRHQCCMSLPLMLSSHIVADAIVTFVP